MARKHLRETETRLLNLKNSLEQISKEVCQKESILQEIKLIQQNEKSIREKVQFLEKKQSKLSFDKERGEELRKRINSEKKESHSYESRQQQLEQNIKNYQTILSKKDEILANYKQYQYLYDENQHMLNLIQEHRKLDKSKEEVERQIDRIKNNLLIDLQQKKQKHSELQEKVNSLSRTKEEVRNLKIKLKRLDLIVQRQEDIQQEGNRLNVEIESKRKQAERIRNEIKQNYEKIDLLIQNKEQYCPLCESPLDEGRRIIIRQNTEKDISRKQYEISLLTKEIEQFSNKKSTLQSEWKENRDTLKQKDEIQNKLATFAFLLKEGKKALEQLKELTREIKNLEEKSTKKLYAQEERKKISEIEKQIQEHGYDDSKYVEINKDLVRYQKAPLQRERLFEAQKVIVDLKKEKFELIERLKSKKRIISNLQKEYQEIIQTIVALPNLEKLIYCHQRLLNNLQQHYTHLFQKKGAYQEKIAKIEKLQQEAQDYKKKQTYCLHQKEIYRKLTAAFGKNGIQSMIIENAIPELEDEANVILGQLSNEETTISLESLKELKSGDVRETLDIKIHDDMGIRPYELYSGGEAFRIDFAIRIALSKLLAYRAGARLKTLVIDEGFGTQDEEGLEKLIQAIHAIQNDFDKILVITHLSLLKDAFPVRIEVWKDPTLGSQFELIHL